MENSRREKIVKVEAEGRENIKSRNKGRQKIKMPKETGDGETEGLGSNVVLQRIWVLGKTVNSVWVCILQKFF